MYEFCVMCIPYTGEQFFSGILALLHVIAYLCYAHRRSVTHYLL